MNLLSNIRFYILLFSVSLSIIFYFWVIQTTEDFTVSVFKLTQIYALSAAAFLYFALLAGPFCYTFKNFPYRAKYLKARRAIGVSAFYFAFLHANFAFFKVIGGLQGLMSLDIKYLFAIFLSTTALIILFVMAVTSFDFIIAKLTFPKWKLLHRFVYLAGIFILTHALLIGSDFHDLSGIIPVVTFIALGFLFILEGLRIYAFFKKSFLPQKSPQ